MNNFLLIVEIYMKSLLFTEIKLINGAGSCECHYGRAFDNYLRMKVIGIDITEKECKKHCCERDIEYGLAKKFDYRGYAYNLIDHSCGELLLE